VARERDKHTGKQGEPDDLHGKDASTLALVAIPASSGSRLVKHVPDVQ
jgi:hypothetical protein